jgi:hypothetical protein
MSGLAGSSTSAVEIFAAIGGIDGCDDSFCVFREVGGFEVDDCIRQLRENR